MKNKPYKFTNKNKLILLTSLDLSGNKDIDNTICESIRTISDWDYVIKHLIRHGTLITFNKHIDRLGLWEHVPVSYAEQMKNTELVFRFRNLRFHDEIKKLALMFHKHDVPVVFIKGSMMLLSGYYTPESRSMEDIDFIVADSYVAKVKALLENIGYIEPNNNGQTLTLNYKGEMQFLNDHDREIMVELAVKLNKNYELSHCYPFNDENIQHKTSEKTVSGICFSEVEKEFHFVYCLFHHISLNYLHRLNWLNDLSLMVSDKAMDFEKVRDYLGRYGLWKSWDLLSNILSCYFSIDCSFLDSSSTGKISPPLRNIFLDNSCRFVNLEELELHNVSIRFLLIDSMWNRIIVVLKKTFLPIESLKKYYNLNGETPSIVVYFIHYRNSLKRFLKIKS